MPRSKKSAVSAPVPELRSSRLKASKAIEEMLADKAKQARVAEELEPVVFKPIGLRSELLEQINRFAPHLITLLQGPQAEPQALPLAGKTTDDLIQLLEFGWLASEVAIIWSVGRAQLSRWIDADRSRSARARLARKVQAEMWDRVAFAIGLFAPSDKVEMARAKLLMDHCKWRSSRYSPDDYVKRLVVEKTTEDTDARKLTTAELQIIAQGGVLPGGF